MIQEASIFLVAVYCIELDSSFDSRYATQFVSKLFVLSLDSLHNWYHCYESCRGTKIDLQVFGNFSVD